MNRKKASWLSIFFFLRALLLWKLPDYVIWALYHPDFQRVFLVALHVVGHRAGYCDVIQRPSRKAGIFVTLIRWIGACLHLDHFDMAKLLPEALCSIGLVFHWTMLGRSCRQSQGMQYAYLLSPSMPVNGRVGSQEFYHLPMVGFSVTTCMSWINWMTTGYSTMYA